MNWGHLREHTDFLRTILNTIILVAGAAGSIITLVKGNTMPVVLSIAAAGIALVFILTELKDRRDKKRGVASTMQAIKSVTNQQSIEGVPYPIVLSSNTTGSAFKTYRNQGGRLIVRLMAAKPVQNTT